jgi:hypothetical protein
LRRGQIVTLDFEKLVEVTGMAETIVVDVSEELGGVTRKKTGPEQGSKQGKQPADKKPKK